MTELAQLRPLAAALAIGLLIGIERGWLLRLEPAGSRVAGFRTFGMLGLAGGIAMLLPVPIASVILFAAAALVVIGYGRASVDHKGRSATTSLAALMTLMLGALAATPYQISAFAAAAVVMALLSMRGKLHTLLKGISADEMESIGRFALIALVVLPVMPDRPLGPYGAINPFQIWMVVVLVCGLSFVGYAASRRAGPTRGLLLTAATGAIVSSTAVTAAYARKLSQPSDSEGALIAGIAIASSTMFMRVMLLAAILVPAALPRLVISMTPAMIIGLTCAVRAVWRLPRARAEIALGNPLDFGPALLLAGMVGALSIALRWAEGRFGEAGMGILLTLTGVADVDAAVLAVSAIVPQLMDGNTAGTLLSAPVIANTLLKAAMTLLIARNRQGARAAAPLFASAAAAGIALILMR